MKEPIFDTYKNPEIIYPKGWGHESWLLNDKDLNICTKILKVNFKRQCSLHYHKKKNEIFWIAGGAIRLEWIPACVPIEDYGSVLEQDLEKLDLFTGESAFIPAGLAHRFLGIHDPYAILVECSTFHEEDDSYRILKGDSQK